MNVRKKKVDFEKIKILFERIDDFFEESTNNGASRGEIAKGFRDILLSTKLNSLERALVCTYIYEAYKYSFK